MAAFDTLCEYLAARGAVFTAAERAVLADAFAPATVPAGGFVLQAGEVASDAFFLARGCLRVYVIDARGREHVVQFLPEQWWWSDGASLTTGVPSQYFVQAIEDSELLRIDGRSHQRLLDRVPAFAATFQAGIQRHNAAKDARIVTALSATAAERFAAFLATYPSIAQRVPQYMIASYFGLTPETLSRLRARAARRGPTRNGPAV